MAEDIVEKAKQNYLFAKGIRRGIEREPIFRECSGKQEQNLALQSSYFGERKKTYKIKDEIRRLQK